MVTARRCLDIAAWMSVVVRESGQRCSLQIRKILAKLNATERGGSAKFTR